MSETIDTAEVTSVMCCEDALEVLLGILNKQRDDIVRDLAVHEQRVIELEAELDDIEERIAHVNDVLSDG